MDLNGCIREADQALFKGKQRGRNCVESLTEEDSKWENG